MMANEGLFCAWRERRDWETGEQRDGGWECLGGSCIRSVVAVVY